MESLYYNIISGAVVAVISFGFGYFLFRSQTNEAIRLEIYRRRLNSYQDITHFLEKIDKFSHRNSDEYILANKGKMADELLGINSARTYLPRAVLDLCYGLYEDIQSLPGSLGALELCSEQIHHLIEKDVGERLANWRTEFFGKKGMKKAEEYFEKAWDSDDGELANAKTADPF